MPPAFAPAVEKRAPMRQEAPGRLVAFITLGANMTRLSIGLIVPLVALVLSIPMILGKVPPNGAYGFRTPKTLSSEDVWYPANRAAGWFMLAAMVVSICFNVALWWTFPEWSLERTTLWMTGGTMIPLAFSVLASFVYLGRL